MRVVLSQQSSVPIYEQIKEQLKASILSGVLCEGELLPSIRQLARELKVSVITTTRAYNDLELEGFIHTVRGKGCYVKKLDSERLRLQFINSIKTTLETAVEHGRSAGLSMQELHKLLDETGEAVK